MSYDSDWVDSVPTTPTNGWTLGTPDATDLSPHLDDAWPVVPWPAITIKWELLEDHKWVVSKTTRAPDIFTTTKVDGSYTKAEAEAKMRLLIEEMNGCELICAAGSSNGDIDDQQYKRGKTDYCLRLEPRSVYDARPKLY